MTEVAMVIEKKDEIKILIRKDDGLVEERFSKEVINDMQQLLQQLRQKYKDLDTTVLEKHIMRMRR